MKRSSTCRAKIFSICVLSFLTILPSEVYSQKTNNSPLPFNQAAVKQSTYPVLLGPDASKPYFHVRFALPIPPDNDKERNGPLVGIDAAVADHHHSPGFEVMPNGDVMIVSFSGPSGREGGPYLRIVQARLRHGAEEFDMPEEITVQGVRMQDLRTSVGKRALSGPPLLWREGSTVWMFIGGHRWEYGKGFRVFKSMDNGANWEIVSLEPKFSSYGGDPQPITNAFRAPNGDMFVATDASYKDFSFGAGASLLWRSSDNGLTWIDQGGRTSSRHSTIVPLDTKGTLLSAGGKDTNLDNDGVVFKDQFKNGYMPQNISTDWGVTWGAATQSPFPWVGGNQRPSVIRLASGNLVLVSDSRHRSLPHTIPAGWTHGDGPFVALSKDNGASWNIKALPVALKHEHHLHKTIGYSTVRQAPNGMIHVFATMTHPCLHYEFNEAWISDPAAGDIAPEIAGGKVKSYKEKYPDGKLMATWEARVTPGGRYLLDGAEKYYYPNGKIQREVTWVSGRRTGVETLWAPDDTRIWSWNHDPDNNVSVWTHWWPNGQKRLESPWNTNPTARDLPRRHFRGLVAHGTVRHWNESGQQVGTYIFHNGDRISHRGNYTETFAISLGGWTGSGTTTDGNNFGWSSTTSHSQNNNAGYMRDKGEIGGVFARSATYRWYADTTIGNKKRTDTLHLSGLFSVANANFEGTFRLGYFNTSSPGSNFIGIEIREPAGSILDSLHQGSGKMLRGYLTVNGPGGPISSEPFELLGGSEKAFDLIWTGNPDGSGTLSGTLQSIPMPTITVAAGNGSFNAFGILSGGDNGSDTTKVTGGCWFDNLNYDIQTLPSSSRTLKIMPMGDSNTAGAGRFPGAQGGYRAPLYTLLKKSGYTFDFVGAKTTNGDVSPYPYHWGQGGAQISRTPGTINGRSYVSIQGENRGGIYEEMSDAISTRYFSTDTSNTRNIILLQIGINDLLHQVVDSQYGSYNTDAGNDAQGEGQEWVAEGMIARLKALLHRIDSLASNRNLRIEVVLGTTCELTKAYVNDDPVSDVLLGEVKEYNNYIKTEIPPIVFSNISVRIVDQYTPTVGKLADGLHPNMEGFIGMAKSWYNAIAVTHSNVSYGQDKTRNRIDFWQAPGDGPRPLLVNIHGGGWITGDKNGYFDYKPFLDRGISCAAINYRLTPENPLPIPVHDAARAIQFLRSKAAEWNIDPDRIALTGGSAGACTSMWLLLHDDLAKPKAKDPVSRQSTRVCAVAAYAGQTSIDPSVISEWIPSTVPMHNMIPYAVGQQSMENVWTDNRYKSRSYKKLYKEFSPINHLDANDPPLYMEYNRDMKLPARSDGDFIHHPMFGIKMWEKSNTTAKGHECHLRITGTNEYKTTTTKSYATGVEFLIDKLLEPSSAQADAYNQTKPSPNLSADKPGTLRFWGSDIADLYTRQIAESYAGVLRKNFVSEPDGDFPLGFLHASPIPQSWSGTFWTRDGGTFLRELVSWGNFEHAWMSTDCLIDLVAKNEEGFFAFPEYFRGREQKAGHELDGTSAIVIGMVILWQRLPDGHVAKARIQEFLHQEGSPVRYILHTLSNNPLLAGSGEFGGGCYIPGMYNNVVQNYLSMLALTAAADMEYQTGNFTDAGNYRKTAQNLRSNILKYLVGEDEAWIWCIDPKTLAPDSAILNHEINLGFGGINGPACMFSDVLGFDPMTSGLPEVKHNLKTFEKLYMTPGRKEQFDKYGIWVQFDVFRGGLSSGPSYGDGYALQTMLLYDKMEMAEKSLKWLATSTYEPVAGYKIDRESPYYFYERSYSPEAVGKVPLEQGCGALNLVNVTEQLKVARLILGVDDTSPEEVKIIPRLPPSWEGMEAKNWPIYTSKGLARADIRVEKRDGVTRFSLSVISGPAIEKLAVRLPDAQDGTHSWYRYTNATKVDQTANVKIRSTRKK